VYITVLSIAGERMAVRIREQLFRAIIKQDIDFFDCHKTGELVSRYVCVVSLYSIRAVSGPSV
jgi:ATP-binding cassette subfamily B (MDR/TAP) protein 8